MCSESPGSYSVMKNKLDFFFLVTHSNRGSNWKQEALGAAWPLLCLMKVLKKSYHFWRVNTLCCNYQRQVAKDL